MYPGAHPIQAQPHVQQSVCVNTSPGFSETVITQQAQTLEYPGGRFWDTGLLDCFSSCPVCMLVSVMYCCYLPYITNKMDESWLLPCVICPPSFMVMVLRIKLRNRFGIQGTIAHDFLVSACCCTHLCAFCQLARQVNILMREGSWY